MQNEIKLYGYRWVILAVFMFINLTIQILWMPPMLRSPGQQQLFMA